MGRGSQLEHFAGSPGDILGGFMLGVVPFWNCFQLKARRSNTTGHPAFSQAPGSATAPVSQEVKAPRQ